MSQLQAIFIESDRVNSALRSSFRKPGEMPEYRITIGPTGREGGGGPRPPQGKLAVLRMWVITVLLLSAAIGILLSAFLIGSVVASLLLIIVAVFLLFGLLRTLFMKLRRTRKED